MSALALDWLRRVRMELERRTGQQADADLQAWAAAVDETVLHAGMRLEDQVRAAAWRYFSMHAAPTAPNPSERTIDLLSEAGPDLHGEWLRIISCGLGREDCGYWWTWQTVDKSIFSNPVADGSPVNIGKVKCVSGNHGSFIVSEAGAVARSVIIQPW